MYAFINDEYRKNRGNTSRIFDVTCEKCDMHVAYYQKDGPGILKRLYVDRFIDTKPSAKLLLCDACGHELGMKTTYRKEDRIAYSLFVGAVKKKVTTRSALSLQG
jgi:transcription elongation factor Elf1